MSVEDPRIFISYRRKDSAYAMQDICARLKEEFGDDSVQVDVESIPLGVDFRERIGEQIEGCNVMLAIIGDNWLEVGAGEESRIHNDDDYVRFELETALERGILLIPVLVGHASIPAKSDLPESLHKLPDKNAAEFRQGPDGPAQLDRLINGIKQRVVSVPQEKPQRWQGENLRVAMVIGVDDYSHTSFAALEGCNDDAFRISGLLKQHSSGEENFEVWTAPEDESRESLCSGIEELFALEADVALFYFAGHAINEELSYLVTQDTTRATPGIAVSELIDAVNNSNALERIVILDCCSANQTGELFVRNKPLSLAEGVSILAIRRDEPDIRDKWNSASATSLICDALEGGGADVTGSVTIADLYNQLNASGGFAQKVYFRANLSSIGTIRQAESSIDKSILANIKVFFPTSPEQEHELSPAYEPTEQPEDKARQAIFGELQQLTKVNLVEPVPPSDAMYWAAMRNGACRLTNLGRFYWLLSNKGRFGDPTKELP